jgi:hypothetical protein
VASVRLGMGVSVTAATSSLAWRGLDQQAEASVAALSLAARRLSEIAAEAADLDERSAAVAEREWELDALARLLAEEHARQLARAAELVEGERALAQQRVAVEEQGEHVAAREALVVGLEAELLDQAQAFEARAERFHWRWFLRAWAWCPRIRSSNARVCELFFVPTPRGYKLLEQTGVALTPDARIRGLLNDGTVYAVTKVAQLPFDGRWCAYLEIDEFRGGKRDD